MNHHPRPPAGDPRQQILDAPEIPVTDHDPARALEQSALDLKLSNYAATDLGNCERFVERFGPRFRFTTALDWLMWDGRRWSARDAELAVATAAQDTARFVQREATALAAAGGARSEDKRRKSPAAALAEHGRRSEGSGRLKALIEVARPHLAVNVDQLDADLWALNVANGTLRFRRGPGDGDPVTLHPHDPGDLISKLAPVDYDPNATCPAYDRFLAEVQPDPQVRRFLHQYGGHCLTGDATLQKFLYFYGKGRNGKSTLMDAWGGVVGDYGSTAAIETFVADGARARTAGAATPDLARLPGVRMLRSSEPEKRSKLAEAFIKAVTGGEPVMARHLNKDFFEFTPQFKLILSGNYRPTVDGTDEGIWRRLVLVPWSVMVANPDATLAERLRGERSGILNRLLDGLRDYLENGMQWPDGVLDATAAYRRDSDPLGRFLEECTAPSPDDRVAAGRLHAIYAAWARANGEHVWSPRGLGLAMRERGYKIQNARGKWWRALRLTVSGFDFAEDKVADHGHEGEEWNR